VKVSDEEKTTVRMTAGVMNFVYWNKKPAIIKEKGQKLKASRWTRTIAIMCIVI